MSEFTSKEVAELLTFHHFIVFTVEKRGAAEARRDIINLAGPFFHEYYHYCDLDRLVTWMMMYPDELELVHRGYMETDGLMYLDFNKSKASSELEEWHARVKLLFYISESIREYSSQV